MASEELSKIRKTLEEHEERLTKLENLLAAKPIEIKKELSIGEFVNEKLSKTEGDKTLVIGYYLERYRGLTSFNVDDLENGFREAKKAIPKNINLAVIANIKKGYMMESSERKDNKKAWTLTRTGMQNVENELGQGKKPI